MPEKEKQRSSAPIEWAVREETGLSVPPEQKEDQALPAGEAKSIPSEGGAGYKRLVDKYKKRQRDTLVDTVSATLSYGSDVAVDLGLMEDTGVLAEITDTVGTALPFAVIAVTEQAKVILGKKTQKAALESTFYRMVKTGAALGVGALAGAVGGVFAAIPAAVGVRVMIDHHKSRALLGNRVAGRTKRLRDLRGKREERTRIEVFAVEPADIEEAYLEKGDPE